MEGLERIVLAHPFFAGLETQLGHLIAGCARNHRFEAGAYLGRVGDPADEFFLIRQGRVALEILPPGRPPVVFATEGEGQIVGAPVVSQDDPWFRLTTREGPDGALWYIRFGSASQGGIYRLRTAPLAPADIARDFEADLVIFMELEQFQIQNPGDLNVLQGSSKVHIKAVELTSAKNSKGKPIPDQPKESNTVYDDYQESVFPIRGPIEMGSGVGRSAFKTKFLQVVASECSWHFVEHTTGDAVQDVRFNDAGNSPYAMNYTDEAAQSLGIKDGKWEAFSTSSSDPLMPSLKAGADSGGAMFKLQWR